MIDYDQSLPTSTIEESALKAVRKFYHCFIHQEDGIVDILKSAEIHVDCLLIQTYAAMLHVLSQSTNVIDTGRKYFDAVERLISTGNDREQFLAKAVLAGQTHEFEKAIEYYEQLLQKYPKDILAALMIEFHCFEYGMPEKQLEVWEALKAKINLTSSQAITVLTSYAYALELNNRPNEAIAIGIKALNLDPTNP